MKPGLKNLIIRESSYQTTNMRGSLGIIKKEEG